MTNLSIVGDETLRVVLAEDRHHFTLASNGNEIGTYRLPDYTQRITWIKVIMTPTAVTGDVLICATVVGIFVLYLYSESNATVDVH